MAVALRTTARIDALTEALRVARQDAMLRDLDTIFINVDADHAFFEQVLQPALAQIDENEAYNISDPKRRGSKRNRNAAECTTISYDGPKIPVVRAVGDDDDAVDPAELQDCLGGMLIFYAWPKDTGEAPLARATSMDRGSMAQLITRLVAESIRLNVTLPFSIRRRVDTMELGTSFSFESMADSFKMFAAAHFFSLFINCATIETYKNALGEQARVVERAITHRQSAEHSAAPADEDPYLTAMREMLAMADRLDAQDEETCVGIDPVTFRPVLKTAEEPKKTTKRRHRKTTQALPQPTPALEVATSSAEVSDTMSLNSVESEIELNVDDARAPYSARLDTHEFSDRLFESGITETDLASNLTTRRANRKLVARVELAFQSAIELVITHCKMRVDKWRSADHFYLYKLAELELTLGGANEQQLGAHTLRAIDTILERQLAFGTNRESVVALVQNVLHSPSSSYVASQFVAPLFENLSLHSVIDSFQVARTSEERRKEAMIIRARSATVVQLDTFIAEHGLLWDRLKIDRLVASSPTSNLLDKILCFSTHDATPLQLVSSVRLHCPSARDGVDYLVVWAPAPYEIARCVESPESCIDVYLAMTSAIWETIALGAIPRHVAEERARGNRVPEWPRVAPLINAAMASNYSDIVAHALAAAQALTTPTRASLPIVWRPGTPQAARSAKHCADLLACVATALTSVEDSEISSSCHDNTLKRLNLALRLADTIEIAMREGEKRRGLARFRVETDSTFAAILVAMTGNEASIAISREGAQHILMQNVISAKLAAFIRTQSILALPVAELIYMQPKMGTDQLNTVAESRARERPPLLECFCGTSTESCERMRTMLHTWQAAKHKTEFKTIECCLCSRHAREAKLRLFEPDWRPRNRLLCKRRRNCGKVGATCAWCANRGVIRPEAVIEYGPECGPDRQRVDVQQQRQEYIVLYNARNRAEAEFTAQEIVNEFVQSNSVVGIEALRICIGGTVVETMVPRNASRRRDYWRTYHNTKRRDQKSATKEALPVEPTTEPPAAAPRRPGARTDVNVDAKTDKFFELAETLAVDDDIATRATSQRNRDRMELLFILESLALTDHEIVATSMREQKFAGDAGSDSVFNLLSPLSAAVHDAAANTVLMRRAALEFSGFPLCPSTVVESMRVGAYGFESISSDERHDVHTRVEGSIVRGRTPAPLTESLPLLQTLAFANWHDE